MTDVIRVVIYTEIYFDYFAYPGPGPEVIEPSVSSRTLLQQLLQSSIILIGQPWGATWMWSGAQPHVPVAAVISDPSADGADTDAEEAGNFGLGVAVQDTGDSETATVFEFGCGSEGSHLPLLVVGRSFSRWYAALAVWPPQPVCARLRSGVVDPEVGQSNHPRPGVDRHPGAMETPAYRAHTSPDSSLSQATRVSREAR
jgi:hypothetical protein